MEKYKSEVDRKFRLLKDQREDVEAEWTAFREGFVETAGEMWPNIKKAHTKPKEQWWWNHEVEKSTQEKKAALRCVEEASGEQQTRLKQKYREKNAANKAVANTRDDKQ